MLQITDIFSARAVALNRTENPSNREAFVGPVFFPNKKKNGRSVKWLKTHKGLNAILMPSSLDAIPMIRTREGFVEEEQTMLFFRESMQVKEEDMMKIQDVRRFPQSVCVCSCWQPRKESLSSPSAPEKVQVTTLFVRSIMTLMEPMKKSIT